MGFILGILLSPWVLFALVIFALLFEHNGAHGWTVATTLVFAVLTAIAFNMSWVAIGIALASWIPIGIAWSVFHWRQYCANIVKKVSDGSMSKETAKGKLDLGDASALLTQWAIVWPFSLTESLFGGVFNTIQDLVTGFFKATYEKIAAKALVKIESLNK